MSVERIGVAMRVASLESVVMYRTSMALMLAVCVGVAVGAQETNQKKFGAALTLNTVTKISEVYAAPDKFDGQRVQVQGPIVDVDPDTASWLAFGSDKEPQSIRFKVTDGAMVFPMSLKGMTARVEGILTLTKGPGPLVTIEIKGEGAIVY